MCLTPSDPRSQPFNGVCKFEGANTSSSLFRLVWAGNVLILSTLRLMGFSPELQFSCVRANYEAAAWSAAGPMIVRTTIKGLAGVSPVWSLDGWDFLQHLVQ